MSSAARAWRSVALAWGLATGAAAEEMPLAALVSADVGLCVELREPGPRLDRFRATPLFQRLRDDPFVTRRFGPETRQRLAALVERELNMPLAEIRDGVFGDRVLFALWPAAPDASAPAAGLLLLRAASAESLARFDAGLTAAQRRLGELKAVQPFRHAGLNYEERLVSRGGREERVYVALVGRLGVLTGSRKLLEQTLTRQVAGRATDGALAQHPDYVAGCEQVPESALVQLFARPRAWDAWLERRLERGPVRVAERAAASVWRHSQYAVAALDLTSTASFRAALQCDWRTQSETLQSASQTLAGPTSFFDRVPAHALAALGGRLDPRPWTTKQAAPGESAGPWARLALSFVDRFGPECGAYLAPGSPADSVWPAQLLVAAAVRPTDASMPQVDGGLRDALHNTLLLGGSFVGLRPEQWKARELDGVRLQTLVDAPRVPAGIAPTYALAQGVLLLGSQPAAVEQALGVAAEASLARQARFLRLAAASVPRASSQFYLDLAGGRKLLQDRRDLFTDRLAAARKLEPDVAARGLDQLGRWLGLADGLLASLRIDEQGLAASLALTAE